ncbi:hypothetical protein [Helicobacter trogontum]|uniref:Uncharacterized protein n=1 Tax=Helicobacter trogontum TaxID=50960 RepID=A0A099VA21_9HELI|nr:hypothetical protein [Helicobacter trogontum]TLD84657.1 hypothetical protein LS81_001215 [Helicobacter trogontum]
MLKNHLATLEGAKKGFLQIIDNLQEPETEFYEVVLLQQQQQGVLYSLISVGSVELITKNLSEAKQTALNLMRKSGLEYAIIKNANEKHRVRLDQKRGLVKW